jgi:hypothetical protein
VQFILSYNITNLTLVVSYTVKLIGAKVIIKWHKLKEYFHVVQPKEINTLTTQLQTIIQAITILFGHINNITITFNAASTTPVTNI